MQVSRSELILGGQKSGKSRRAELLARDWLAQSPAHHALLIATAQPWDGEMRERIARHQRDRAERVPGLQTLEEPRDLAAALAQHSTAHTLVVVDCLTLWLTNLLMLEDDARLLAEREALLDGLSELPGRIILVSNESGLGVVPMGELTRRYVDEAGWLHQAIAERCQRVVFTVAGLPMLLKGMPL